MESMEVQPTTASSEPRKNYLIIRVLVISSIVIFLIESFVMLFLETALALPQPLVLVLDGLILIVLLFPLNYFFIVKPLSRLIEEHQETNQELLKSSEILERFFSINDISIAYMDTDFNFLRVNQAFATTDGHLPAKFVGKNLFDLFPNEDNRMFFEAVVKTGEANYSYERPFEYAEHPERGVTYWDWSLLPIKTPEGQVIALLLVLNNVTARKKAELAQADSERRFRGVFNQAFQQSVLLDPQGKALLVNQTALDFSGFAHSEIEGLPLWQIPWWDTSAPANLGIVEQLQFSTCQAAEGIVVRSEYQVKAKNGESAMMDITIKPLVDEAGSTMMLIYEARDISARIAAAESLKRSEVEINRLYQAEMNAHRFAETLRSAVLAFSGSLNSETVLKTLLDHLYKVVPYTSAHILVLEDENHLNVRLVRGEEEWPEDVRLSAKRIAIDDLPFLSQLLEQREILSVPDTLLYSGARFLPIDKFVRCWLGIPLLAGEQVVGICLLEHTCPGFFNEDLVHWATALTGQAAVSIHNAWLFEQVRDGREQLQALSRRLVEIQEHERHYIARELHDEASQMLASLMFGLRHLENDSGDQAAVIEHCQYLKEITDSVLENLHRLAVDLRPASLDHLGLVPAMRQYIQTLSIKQGLSIQFEIEGDIERLPGEMETAIYRIVQESLTNVIRHANASQVGILLEKRNAQLIVIIEDDGIGFNPQAPKGNQLGILGMKERAEVLGGSITIESSQGKGSTIILEVPWQFES